MKEKNDFKIIIDVLVVIFLLAFLVMLIYFGKSIRLFNLNDSGNVNILINSLVALGTISLALVTFRISKSDRLYSAFSYHKNDIDKTVEDLIKNCDNLNIDLFSELKKIYRSEEPENNINIKSTNLRTLIPALLNLIFYLTTENRKILEDIFEFHLNPEKIEELDRKEILKKNLHDMPNLYEYLIRIITELNRELKEIGLTVYIGDEINPFANLPDEAIILTQCLSFISYRNDINNGYEIWQGEGVLEEVYFIGQRTPSFFVLASSKDKEKLEKLRGISLFKKEKMDEFHEKNNEFKTYCKSFCRQVKPVLVDIKISKNLKKECPYTSSCKSKTAKF